MDPEDESAGYKRQKQSSHLFPTHGYSRIKSTLLRKQRASDEGEKDSCYAHSHLTVTVEKKSGLRASVVRGRYMVKQPGEQVTEPKRLLNALAR